MVGIVVIAHAPLASALSQCAEHVYSCEPNARRELRALDVDDADLAQTVTGTRTGARGRSRRRRIDIDRRLRSDARQRRDATWELSEWR